MLLGIKTGALTRCIIVLVSESALWDTMAFESYKSNKNNIRSQQRKTTSVEQEMYVKRRVQCGLTELKIAGMTGKIDRNKVLILARHLQAWRDSSRKPSHCLINELRQLFHSNTSSHTE